MRRFAHAMQHTLNVMQVRKDATELKYWLVTLLSDLACIFKFQNRDNVHLSKIKSHE